MTKGLEALKHLYTRAPATTNAICVMDYEIIQKELKALEIIKEHWNFEYLKSGFGSKGLVQIKPISMEDADLLSEVLL